MNCGLDPDLKMKLKTRNHTHRWIYKRGKEKGSEVGLLFCIFAVALSCFFAVYDYDNHLEFGFGISKQLQYLIKTTQTKIATRINQHQTGSSFLQQENQAWRLPA